MAKPRKQLPIQGGNPARNREYTQEELDERRERVRRDEMSRVPVMDRDPSQEATQSEDLDRGMPDLGDGGGSATGPSGEERTTDFSSVADLVLRDPADQYSADDAVRERYLAEREALEIAARNQEPPLSYEEALEQVMARQMSQSTFRMEGGGPTPEDFARTADGQIPFRSGLSGVHNTARAMQADGFGSMDVRTILRQHESDLGAVAASRDLDPVQAEQVGFAASDHRRQVNGWERSEISAGRLSANPHLPSAEADLLDEQVELETLREGLSVSSGIQFADPAQLSFQVPGYDLQGQLDAPGVPTLGPKATARLAKHPQLAEAIGGPTGVEADLEARTAHIQSSSPEAEEGYGMGRFGR